MFICYFLISIKLLRKSSIDYQISFSSHQPVFKVRHWIIFSFMFLQILTNQQNIFLHSLWLDDENVRTCRLSQDPFQCWKAWKETSYDQTFFQGGYQVLAGHAEEWSVTWNFAVNFFMWSSNILFAKMSLSINFQDTLENSKS